MYCALQLVEKTFTYLGSNRLPVTTFASWQHLCDAFSSCGQLGKRHVLLLNPVTHCFRTDKRPAVHQARPAHLHGLAVTSCLIAIDCSPDCWDTTGQHCICIQGRKGCSSKLTLLQNCSCLVNNKVTVLCKHMQIASEGHQTNSTCQFDTGTEVYSPDIWACIDQLDVLAEAATPL